ncbi:NAD(P)-dependent oxidoreductase [Cellulomonas marina]|nr:NAD(P)-dependent oxidoreductase [Cellulomonas marina]
MAAALAAGATPPAGDGFGGPGAVPGGVGVPDLRMRLVVRDPLRAPQLEPVEVAVASYGDGEACRRAFDGADVLVLVSAGESVDRLDQHRTAVEAAAAAGVRHVVYTSFAGAAPDATFTLARDHAATEEALRSAGLSTTVLRDNLYLDLLPAFVGEDGTLRGPAGDGRVAGVAREDVVRCAATVVGDVLRDPVGDRHAGATYEVTGPEALTLEEVAAVLTAAGRPTRYVPETLEEAYASRERFGAPAWQVEAWVSTYTAIAHGEMAAVSRDVERLTGLPPLSLAELLAR